MGIETVMMALAIGGSVVGAAGDLQQGAAADKAAQFNADVAEQRARSEREAAAIEAQDFKREEMRKLAASRTARATTGVTSAGSPLMVEESVVREIALGASRLRFGGEVRGTRLDQDAELSRMQGRSAKTASYFKAGSSILSSFGQFA